jgi:hypothetical protein
MMERNRSDSGLLDQELINGVAHGETIGEGAERGAETCYKGLDVDRA